ncbi:hypothetical protein M758_12G037400 [Ceratodon purpureus]|nr:hypothetical protein M758_12G037400 [Ceratodon purpureus]
MATLARILKNGYGYENSKSTSEPQREPHRGKNITTVPTSPCLLPVQYYFYSNLHQSITPIQKSTPKQTHHHHPTTHLPVSTPTTRTTHPIHPYLKTKPTAVRLSTNPSSSPNPHYSNMHSKQERQQNQTLEAHLENNNLQPKSSHQMLKPDVETNVCKVSLRRKGDWGVWGAREGIPKGGSGGEAGS